MPARAALPTLSLGYDRALADLLWMKALVYIGDEFEHRGAIDHVFRYAEAMLELDPDFRAVYPWIGVVGLYRPQAIDRGDVERVVAIQRRGLERFPGDGALMWDLAGNLQYELRPRLVAEGASEAELEALDAEAAELFLGAASRGAAPPWVVLSSARTLETLGARDRAIARLEQLYVLVDDPSTRQGIAARLAQLRGEQAMATIGADFERLQREHAEHPWIPRDFFGLIRPTPLEAALLERDAGEPPVPDLMDGEPGDMLAPADATPTTNEPRGPDAGGDGDRRLRPR